MVKIMNEIVKKTENLMLQTIEVLKKDLSSVSTGRATPSLLDAVRVESYGNVMSLNKVANVSVADLSTLVIQAWDKGTVSNIEKAIQNANLGFNPQTEGMTIRINVPKLSEERRKEMCKIVKKYGDDKKVSIKNKRKEANEELKKMKGTISDDQIKKIENDVQKLTDKFNLDIDKLVEEKTKLLLTF